MTEETKNASSKFAEILKGILKPGAKTDSVSPQIETPKFRWFALVTIPDTKDKTIQTFNDEVAQWTQESLQRPEDLSFLELYLTRNAMNRLSSEVKIDRNSEALAETIDRRLSNTESGVAQASSRVALNLKGLLITPALQHLFDNAFIARATEPPQVYAPADESKIPSNVNQYLIGVLKIEDARGKTIGETPIRALSSAGGAHESILRVYTHTDFDILLKAFHDEPFCSYPLGINILTVLEQDGMRRTVSQVDLDIHDAQMIASMSKKNENTILSYYLLEGGYKQKDIHTYPGDTYPVDLKSEKDSQDFYDVAPGLAVRVSGKVGLQVVLKYKNARGQVDTDSYTFLFRFFRHALKFSTGTNKLAAEGQFVRGLDDTTVMLPPLFKDGSTESQTPAFVISPIPDQEGAFDIRKHPDSTLSLSWNGEPISNSPMRIQLSDRVDIQGENGVEGDSQYETFVFTLRPLRSLNDERKKLAAAKADRGYVGFVDVSSSKERTISLAKSEIVIGRNRFLHRSANVSANALTLTRRYVTWLMSAKEGDKIFYYCTVDGTVTESLRQITQPVLLGIVATYYVYVNDFEFMIFLESTPSNEILLSKN